MELAEQEGALDVLLRGIDATRGEEGIEETEGEFGLRARIRTALRGSQPGPRDGEPFGDPRSAAGTPVGRSSS